MKFSFFSGLILMTSAAFSQNLQVHYDFRHSLDPALNPRNFPSFSFEYFKNIDTVGTGSFLFKVQADLKGSSSNMGQIFTQLSQSLRFWKPKVFLSLNYSGGLGLTLDGYGFYISNAYGVGASYPFQWKGAFLAVNAQYRLNAFPKPSHDVQLVFYFGKGFNSYRIFVTGSIVSWTENRNQGTDFTRDLSGKKFAFFGDPQVWIKIKGGFSLGSRINLFYHTLIPDNVVQAYPTIGTRFQF